MTMVEMDLRFPRAAAAKVSFAPPIIHLALFGSIAHNNQVIPISGEPKLSAFACMLMCTFVSQVSKYSWCKFGK